jgi:hypothetical protein
MLFVEIAEGLHKNGARSLQLTKGSSMRGTGFKCIENKYQGLLYAWFELGCIKYSPYIQISSYHATSFNIQHKTECKKSSKTRRILSAPNLERACNTHKTCLTVGHQVALKRT